ncbi:hypothetical protein KGY72_08700 [Candidatus Bipolaricaulota bacterium]|nr:hypothetical protein [Candidatus Bipolaricaulota bacterium]
MLVMRKFRSDPAYCCSNSSPRSSLYSIVTYLDEFEELDDVIHEKPVKSNY